MNKLNKLIKQIKSKRQLRKYISKCGRSSYENPNTFHASDGTEIKTNGHTGRQRRLKWRLM